MFSGLTARLHGAAVWLDAHLVADWRKAGRWWSVRIPAIGAAMATTWTALPSDLRSSLPAGTAQTVLGVLFLLTILGRLKDQSGGQGGSNDADQ